MAEGQLQPPRDPHELMMAGSERPRLLVVDDIRVNRMLVRNVLEPLDAEMVLVENGAIAVDSCRVEMSASALS